MHRVDEGLERQIYKNFEQIIIDDESMDETKALVDARSDIPVGERSKYQNIVTK